MATKPVAKSEDFTGHVYRVKSAENAKVHSWHMSGRLKGDELVLCVGRGPGKTHRYVPLWYDLDGLKVYPEAFTFVADPIGEPVEVPEVEKLLEQLTRPARPVGPNGVPNLVGDPSR